VLAVLFALVATVQCVLAGTEEKTVDYTFSIKNEKNPKSSGAEVRIYSIDISGREYDLNLLSDYGSIQEEGTLLIYPYEHDVAFRIEAGVFDIVEVELLRHPWSGILYVFDGEKSYSTDLYSATSEVIVEKYEYENTTKVMLEYVQAEKLALVAYWFIFFLVGLACFWFIHFVMIKINTNTFQWWMIPLLFIVFFIVIFLPVYACLWISPKMTVAILFLATAYCLFRIHKTISLRLENI